MTVPSFSLGLSPIGFGRVGNELRAAQPLVLKFPVVVVGIIISQLINVHIIINEDEETRARAGCECGWKCQLSLYR